MSFPKLQEKILAEAGVELEKIRQQLAAELSAEEERIKNRAREIEEEIIEEAQRRADQEAKRLRQAAQLRAKADILKAKQEELEATRQETVTTILGWNNADMKQLLNALMDRLPEGQGEITAGAEHADLVAELAAARHIKVMKEPLPGQGGFLYRGKDAEINLTIDYLVEQVFDRHRAELAQTLL